jgi:chromosome segregation ATPase
MTRLGITSAAVELAAENILAGKENPTIEKVRQALGGTGSNSTIAKYLHKWRVKRLAIHAAVDQIWQQIHEKSQQEIKQAHDQTQEAVRLAHAQRDEALAACGHLIQQFEELQKKFRHISADKELLSLDLKALQQAHQLLHGHHQSLEQRYQLLEQQSSTHIKDLKEAQQQALGLHQQEIASLKISL